MKNNKNTKVLLTYLIPTILVFAVLFFLVVNMSSKKKEYRNEAITLYNSGDISGALESFNKALECRQWFSDDLDKDIRYYMADCYMQLEDFNAAKEIYTELKNTEELSNKEYINTKLDYIEAMLSFMDGDYTSPIDVFIYQAENGNYNAYLYLAACYQDAGDYEAMIKCFDDYMIYNDINSYIAYQLSAYYLSIDDLSNTKLYVEKGLSLEDKAYIDKIEFNEIVYYEKIKDFSTAYIKAKSYCEKYPDNEKAKTELTFLDTRININETPVHIEE